MTRRPYSNISACASIGDCASLRFDHSLPCASIRDCASNRINTVVNEPNTINRMRCFASVFKILICGFSSYPWLLDYVNYHSQHTTRHLTVNTAVRQAESGKTVASHQLLPGHGMHYFRYQNRFVFVERQREKQSIQKDGFRTPFETVTLKTIGKVGNICILYKLLQLLYS